MIAFAFMLEHAAAEAGIPVPKNSDCFNKNEYPQFEVFCKTQLNRAMHPGEHFENAKNLAKIDIEKLKTMTWNELADLGVCPHADKE